MESLETIIKLTYWTIMALVAILFLLNLQHTIRAVSPENRKMKPGDVWMQLLPLHWFVLFICMGYKRPFTRRK
ncbi:MAG: hypothetical protein BGO31_06500 [Bacteroidetes bacterium 43-16]|nr:MAG: hypothetical protein BGO31_06500 [Bacteroidetes bacterium 43-16]